MSIPPAVGFAVYLQRAKLEDLPGFVGSGDIHLQFVDDADHALDQLRVALGQFAVGVVDVVLHADADAAALEQTVGHALELVRADGHGRTS